MNNEIITKFFDAISNGKIFEILRIDKNTLSSNSGIFPNYFYEAFSNFKHGTDVEKNFLLIASTIDSITSKNESARKKINQILGLDSTNSLVYSYLYDTNMRKYLVAFDNNFDILYNIQTFIQNKVIIFDSNFLTNTSDNNISALIQNHRPLKISDSSNQFSSQDLSLVNIIDDINQSIDIIRLLKFKDVAILTNMNPQIDIKNFYKLNINVSKIIYTEKCFYLDKNVDNNNPDETPKKVEPQIENITRGNSNIKIDIPVKSKDEDEEIFVNGLL